MSRRSEKKYFASNPEDPLPLLVEVKRVVRFEEVDLLKIVWHGRYPSYFEDGRSAFGEKFGLGYLDIYESGLFAPIVQLHIEHHGSLEFGEEFIIRTELYWTNANRLNFVYKLINKSGITVASGYTVQLFTDLERNALLIRPKFFEDFLTNWKYGRLK